MTAHTHRTLRFLIVGVVVLLLFIGALAFGATNYSLSYLWQGFVDGAHQKVIVALYELRLSRNVAALLVGAALGVSGCIMQAVTRNPLADPGLLGLTAGANAGLSLAIAFVPSLPFLGVMGASFVGATIGALLVLSISSSQSIFKVILAGAAISALLMAIADGIMLLFKTSQSITMWTAGGLIGVTWKEVQLITPIILVTLVISLFLSKKVGLISMSNDVGIGLGLNIKRTKLILFLLTTLLTGAAVSLIGNMAFVGLIVPHMARFLIGPNYRYQLPMAALVGAGILLLADTLSRSINPPFEIPIVAILSILGLPFFLYIVQRGGVVND
ncbi:FecCD family ABC transporter permease [Brochothrix thermosphacta]|uniref:FecCD family ABC transporter permease n=1 Tax=Brochothrix thermosphacta TaxID=2756 RepID=UPI003F9CD506